MRRTKSSTSHGISVRRPSERRAPRATGARLEALADQEDTLSARCAEMG